MNLEEALKTFETWEEVVQAYIKGLIDSQVLVDLMEYYNVR